MSFLLPLASSWAAGILLLFVDGRRRGAGIVAVLALAGIFVADVVQVASFASGTDPLETVTGGWPQGVGIRLRADLTSAAFGALVALVLLAAMMHELLLGVRGRMFPALLLLLCTGLHGIFASGDLFNLYVFFEVAVVSSFVLAAYTGDRAELRGTFVYVVVNMLGSTMFLTGVAATYHAFGTLDLESIAAAEVGDAGAPLLAATLILAALSLKLGMFPFHYWVPVLYSHARPAVAAALAGALGNVGAYGLIRLGFGAFAGVREQSSTVLLVLGCVGILYAATLAAARPDRAYIAAYAAVVQAGYLMIAIAIGGEAGVGAALFMAVAGSIDKSALFLALDRRAPGRSFPVLVAASSVAGLPPTAGFVAKLLLLRAAVDVPGGWAVAASIVISAALLLAGTYRFWLKSTDRQTARGSAAAVMVTVLAAVLLAFGVLPDPLVAMAGLAAVELLGEAS